MPAIDQCHNQVVRTLQKAGWTVDSRPYTLTLTSRRRLYIDIKARREQDEIIVVEVKCFARDELNELYTAVGQYMIYRSLLRAGGISRQLYLAVPAFAYRDIFSQLAMNVVFEAKIKLIVIDLDREVIEQWLE